MDAQIIARATRGTTVESVHRGHLIIMSGDGQTLMSVGDPSTVTFFRSACKAFQAVPFITSGAADRFGFDEREIALACASHSGEPMHVEIAKGMLEKISMNESELRCGSHLPFNEAEAERILRAGEQPTQLHNNCSGKHAAMLAVARQIGADTSTYDDPRNPVQQMILGAVSLFTEVPKNSIRIGIDGCSAPNFALPLSAMAKSFLNLMNPPPGFDSAMCDASRRIVSAMLHFPELIGGTGRLDTMITQAAPGRVISKVGADGVWLSGVLPSEKWPTGLAVALKIEDGDDKRARPVVAVEILRQIGVLSNGDLPDISPMPVKNRRGDSVGKITADSLMLSTSRPS
jgi:L-asparaginase II